MKNLKDIFEGILDKNNKNNVGKATVNDIIIEYINEHYCVNGTIEIHKLIDDDPKYEEWKRGRYQVKIVGNLDVKDRTLTTLTHDLFYFWIVTGNFECKFVNLENLHGAPTNVYGKVEIGYIPTLTSLEGFPLNITGRCKISSLPKIKGFSEIHKSNLMGGIYISCMNIKSLDGIHLCSGNGDVPIEINCCSNLTTLTGIHYDNVKCTSVYLSELPKLKSLNGLPDQIYRGKDDYGEIDLLDLNITNLVGCPSVSHGLEVTRCKKLTSGKGSPKKILNSTVGIRFDRCPNLETLDMDTDIVNGGFGVTECPKLKSFENCPKIIDGNVYCDGRFKEKDVITYCKKLYGSVY